MLLGLAFTACLRVNVVAAAAATTEPNPPTWPSTVRVFSPEDTDIEDVVNAAYAR
jgi:hypothetical protein